MYSSTMASQLLILLTLILYASATEVQDQIKKLRESIQALQTQLEEDHAFLVESQARVERLEQIYQEMKQERIELCKFISAFFP